LITGIILPLRDHACVRPWGIDDGKSPADIRGKKVNVRIINRFQISFGTGQEVTDLIVDMPKQVELFVDENAPAFHFQNVNSACEERSAGDNQSRGKRESD
jgi:hypothetical protein